MQMQICWEILGHGIHVYITMMPTNSIHTDTGSSPYLAIALPYSSSLLRLDNAPHDITKTRLCSSVSTYCAFFLWTGGGGGTQQYYSFCGLSLYL